MPRPHVREILYPDAGANVRPAESSPGMPRLSRFRYENDVLAPPDPNRARENSGRARSPPKPGIQSDARKGIQAGAMKTEQQKRRARLNRTLQRRVNNLKEHRARWHCEICGRHRHSTARLEGAHIRRRASDGSNDTVDNLIIACLECHNHAKYSGAGLSISREKALRIVKIRNKEFNIGEEGLPL